VDITSQACELCSSPGGTLLWESPALRIVRVADPDYPGFCRVIWTAHVREMSDLDSTQRGQLMSAVVACEQVIRRLFEPDKINLASFGNVVPHVHWHVIPRWHDDRHFPNPVWGESRREGLRDRALVSDEVLAKALVAEMQAIGSESP